MPVFMQKASTSESAITTLNRWEENGKCKYAVAHVGVNDVTNGTSANHIIDNIKSMLDIMHEKLPNAVIAFSEILYIGRGERDSNDNEAITKINKQIKSFCTQRDFTYVTHTSLQSTGCKLFEDEKHLDSHPGVDTVSGNWEFDQKNLGIWELDQKNLGIWELIIFGNWEFKYENLGIWE